MGTKNTHAVAITQINTDRICPFYIQKLRKISIMFNIPSFSAVTMRQKQRTQFSRLRKG